MTTPTKHNHYFKDVKHLDTIDVYRTLKLFGVEDPCLQHAIKKLLAAGARGAGKNQETDIQEAIDSLTRWQEMNAEDLDKIKSVAETAMTTAINAINSTYLNGMTQKAETEKTTINYRPSITPKDLKI